MMQRCSKSKAVKKNSAAVLTQPNSLSFTPQKSALRNASRGKKMHPKTDDERLLKEMGSLDSTDCTDIIECSIEEEPNRLNIIKNGNSHCMPENAMLLNDIKIKNFKKHSGFNYKNSRDFIQGAVKTQELDASLAENRNKTPSTNKNNPESSFTMRKIISSLKKTPEGSYLSRSKLRNIENWLNENKVEMVSTPPFANLSVTPRSLKKNGTPFRKFENDSSIDSEVEDVLKAVYGDDWMKENVNSNFKTKSKRKPSSTCPTVTGKKTVKSCKTARRNILNVKNSNDSYNDDEEIVDLEKSFVSGIKRLNFNDSNCSEEYFKDQDFTNGQKPKLDGKVPDNLPKNTFSDANAIKEVMGIGEKQAKKRIPASSAKKKLGSSLPTPKKTFLASLSVSTPTSKCHPDAQFYKINFKSKKDELIRKLFKLFNNEVFDSKLAADMNFGWNIKLRGTAGYCYNKRITKSTGEVIRTSRIEFSTKIVDRADRLRDTMIHELCHAASWVIDGRLDGHGATWNKWASKAMVRFPELPTIKRCHNYKIVSKYVYRCTGCGYSINRHSKSIDTERKRCGYCYGILELLVNKKRRGKTEIPEFDTTKTLRTPNKFALFVKENYQNIKSTMGNAKHAEIMKILSQKYAVIKTEIKYDDNALRN